MKIYYKMYWLTKCKIFANGTIEDVLVSSK